MTLTTLITEYLLTHQIGNSSPATLRYYRENLTRFADFLCNPDIATVTLAAVRSYIIHLQSRSITSTSLQTYIRAVRAFLTWCYREGYIAEDIPARLKLPKATRKAIDILSDTEVARLLNSIDTRTFIGLRDMVVVLLMLDSGMRLAEVLRQTTDTIHLESGYLIAIGKGNKERFVPLGLHTRKYLIKYLARLPTSMSSATAKTTLVVKDNLTAAKPSTIRQLFRRLKLRASIPRLRPHLLRHTFATAYLRHGGDVYTLQAILGHTTLEMTKRYEHLTALQKLDRFPKYSPIDNLLKP